MNRFVQRFSATMVKTPFSGTIIKTPEDMLNKFLNENPKYRISCMTYANQNDSYYGIIAYFEEIEENK